METLFIVAWMYTCAGFGQPSPYQYGLELSIFDNDKAAYAQYDEAVACWEARKGGSSFVRATAKKKKPQLYRINVNESSGWICDPKAVELDFDACGDLEVSAHRLDVRPAREYVVVKSSVVILGAK